MRVFNIDEKRESWEYFCSNLETRSTTTKPNKPAFLGSIFVFLNLLMESFVHWDVLNIRWKSMYEGDRPFFWVFEAAGAGSCFFPFSLVTLRNSLSSGSTTACIPLRAARYRVNLMQSVALVIKHRDFLMKLYRAHDFTSSTLNYHSGNFRAEPYASAV